MSPSRRSSLKQTQLTESGYFPGASLLPPILVLFPHITCVKHLLLPCNEGLTGLVIHEQTCMPNWDSTSSHSSHVKHSPYWHHPVRCSLIRFLIGCQHTKWDHSPIGAPNDWPGKRACAKTAEANVSSGHSIPQGNRELPETPMETPNNGMGASGSTEEHSSEDNTDHCGDKSTKISQGRMWLTLIWNQPLGIFSLVQTWRRWPLELHEGGSRRGYRPPVVLKGAALGLRPK